MVDGELKGLQCLQKKFGLQSFSDIINNNMQRRKVFGDSDSEEDVEELGMGAEVDEEADDGADSAKGRYFHSHETSVLQCAVAVRYSVGRGDQSSKPPAAISKLGQFLVTPLCVVRKRH